MADGIHIPMEEFKQRVTSLLSGLWATNTGTYAGYSDTHFYLPTRQELADFLSQNPIQAANTSNQSFDCDDYSFALKGRVSLFSRSQPDIKASLGLGIAWGMFAWVGNEFHACNWALDKDLRFLWIEPQNGKTYTLDYCTGDIEFILV